MPKDQEILWRKSWTESEMFYIDPPPPDFYLKLQRRYAVEHGY
jgi:hypothetical protein